MRNLFLCCEVFTREACLAVAHSRHVIDPIFTPKGAHDRSEYLNQLLQQHIDEAEKRAVYDTILLGFGLCGNSIAGLLAKNTPMVVPRAHDCCTVFLGSKESFIKHFKNRLSASWSATGYMERGDESFKAPNSSSTMGFDFGYDEFVKKYGEEHAAYLWEMMHPQSNEVIYIDMQKTARPEHKTGLEEQAAKEGKKFVSIQGNMRLIDMLVNGNWNDQEFLQVPPGRPIQPVYDQDRIIRV